MFRTDTASGNFGPSLANTICDAAPQQKLRRAIAATCLLLVSNTTTVAEAAKPKTFDVSSMSTSASAPLPISGKSVAKPVDDGDRIITRIREVGMLNDGWHREKSLGASQTAVDEAERYARSIDWQHHKAPTVSLTEDGEINFLWQSDALYLDVGFFGDGTYTFFGKSADGKVFLGDDLPLSDPLPSELLALMSIPA